MNFKTLSLAAPVLLSICFKSPVVAQTPIQNSQLSVNANQTAMILYPVEMGPNGQQYITTKAGYKITVPGLGLAPNASQIAVYRDPQNNYWYIDKNGNPTPVSPQQMQTVMSQIQNQAMQRGQVQYGQNMQGMAPQNAYAQTPMAATTTGATTTTATQPQQNQNSSNNNNGGNNNANSAMISGLAAAGGAAMGSMITNSIYNNNNNSQYGYGGIPYGAPVYRGTSGQYYYANQAGKPVYVTPNSANTAALNQYAQQSAYTGKPYSESSATTYPYSSQQEQAAKQQQNEQAAQSIYKQQQSAEQVQTAQKQQQAEQAAEQDKGGSGRRRLRHNQESQSTDQSAQNLQSEAKASAATDSPAKRRGRLGR